MAYMAQSHSHAAGGIGCIKIERINPMKSGMSSSSRIIRHFVLTVGNGKFVLSQAREIVPNRTYEILHVPRPLVTAQWSPEKDLLPQLFSGMYGEPQKIKSELS